MSTRAVKVDTRSIQGFVMRTKVNDISGQTFGRLTVINFSGFKTYSCPTRFSVWSCKCSCGVIVKRTLNQLRCAQRRGNESKCSVKCKYRGKV